MRLPNGSEEAGAEEVESTRQTEAITNDYFDDVTLCTNVQDDIVSVAAQAIDVKQLATEAADQALVSQRMHTLVEVAAEQGVFHLFR